MIGALHAYGEARTIGKWLADPRCAVRSRLTIAQRLEAGWSPERAIAEPPTPRARRRYGRAKAST